MRDNAGFTPTLPRKEKAVCFSRVDMEGSKVDLRVDLDWLPVRLHLHHRLAMTSSV